MQERHTHQRKNKKKANERRREKSCFPHSLSLSFSLCLAAPSRMSLPSASDDLIFLSPGIKEPACVMMMLALTHSLTRQWEKKRRRGGGGRQALGIHIIITISLSLQPFPCLQPHDPSCILSHSLPVSLASGAREQEREQGRRRQLTADQMQRRDASARRAADALTHSISRTDGCGHLVRLLLPSSDTTIGDAHESRADGCLRASVRVCRS